MRFYKEIREMRQFFKIKEQPKAGFQILEFTLQRVFPINLNFEKTDALRTERVFSE